MRFLGPHLRSFDRLPCVLRALLMSLLPTAGLAREFRVGAVEGVFDVTFASGLTLRVQGRGAADRTWQWRGSSVRQLGFLASGDMEQEPNAQVLHDRDTISCIVCAAPAIEAKRLCDEQRSSSS